MRMTPMEHLRALMAKESVELVAHARAYGVAVGTQGRV